MQLLDHLDLGDMERSTDHPFLFEAAPDQAAVEAAAAAAANSMAGVKSTKSSVHARVSVGGSLRRFGFNESVTCGDGLGCWEHSRANTMPAPWPNSCVAGALPY